MLPRYRNILAALLLLFLSCAFLLAAVVHDKAEDYALGEARKLALNALLVHRATHAHVTLIQRPEIYRLQREGKLYAGYFAPQVMSFTYISRSIKDLLNEERGRLGLEPIYFKLAAETPRNPVNQADAAEVALLRRMNAGELNEYQEVIRRDGKQWLYLAIPIERSGPGCMKCHGDPADAPAELVAMYGDQAGFHESPDGIRALISIRVPMDGISRAGRQMADLLTGLIFAVFTGLYVLLAVLIRRIDRQERRIRAQNDELERRSITDALTGVFNRHGLQLRGDELLAQAHRYRHPLALLILDLDHFKRINDLRGHGTGDTVLREFAATIRARLRASDVFGRWGGEEFLLIAPHLAPSDALALGEQLRTTIERATFDDGVRLTVSIGIAAYQPGEGLADLTARADRALYRAKESGRNRVLVDR
jgi:diguanylate cyclase (GGDEF)-like protein